MSKIAFLFPGQGAQYVGMGKELYNNFEECKAVYHKASEVLGYSITDVCFNSEEDFLGRTDNTQPALFTTSVAILEILKNKGIVCDATAGLSLGEYSALVCSGILNFEETLELVKNRGKYMQDCAEEVEGTLAAIIGLDVSDIEEVLEGLKNQGIVDLANLNCPNQIVIGGEVKLVEKAMELCTEKGAKKVVKLNVRGAFHTELLKQASEKLVKDLEKLQVSEQNVPIAMNLTGKYLSSDENLVEIMRNQVMSTVRFEECIRTLINDGIDTFIEVGPNKVLSGFVKKIDRKLITLNIEDIESLNKAIEKLGVK